MKKIKMTKEVREQLTGIIPMRKGAVYSFTPDDFIDVPVDFRPVFRIRQLSQEQVNVLKQMLLAEANDTSKKGASKQVKEVVRKNKVYMEMLHSVLDGFDNVAFLADVDGEVEFLEYDGSIDSMLEVPESTLTAVFNEVMKITGFLPKGLL